MNTLRATWAPFGLAISLSFSLVGCLNQSSFSQIPSISQSSLTPSQPTLPEGPSCKDVLETTQAELRILFMSDNSGSTADTDPNHMYRVQTLERFLTDYGSKTNFTYNFNYFSASVSIYNPATNAFTTNASTVSAPFGNSAALSSALTLYKTRAPSGGTAYLAAFNRLKSILSADLEANGNKYQYVIIFMSDGEPTDISGGAATITQTLMTRVNEIKTLASDVDVSLSFSTVYFGPNNSDVAKQNLKTMSTAGGGQFIDTNDLNGDALKIDDLITVAGQVCSE